MPSWLSHIKPNLREEEHLWFSFQASVSPTLALRRGNQYCTAVLYWYHHDIATLAPAAIPTGNSHYLSLDTSSLQHPPSVFQSMRHIDIRGGQAVIIRLLIPPWAASTTSLHLTGSTKMSNWCLVQDYLIQNFIGFDTTNPSSVLYQDSRHILALQAEDLLTSRNKPLKLDLLVSQMLIFNTNIDWIGIFMLKNQ